MHSSMLRRVLGLGLQARTTWFKADLVVVGRGGMDPMPP